MLVHMGVILTWLGLGLIAGALGRLIVPSSQSWGLSAAVGLATLGAFVAGVCAWLATGRAPAGVGGLTTAAAGATLALWAAKRLEGRQSESDADRETRSRPAEGHARPGDRHGHNPATIGR